MGVSYIFIIIKVVNKWDHITYIQYLRYFLTHSLL